MDIIDSIELGTAEGFDIRAELVPDTATHHAEPDGDYTPEQIAWFNDGDWHYVGLIVTASRAGTDLGSDSLWGVEAGTMPLDNGEVDPCKRLRTIDPLRDADGSLAIYREDMVGNAVADARLNLTQLIDAAIDDSMGKV
jgi:hypothetical protein